MASRKLYVFYLFILFNFKKNRFIKHYVRLEGVMNNISW